MLPQPRVQIPASARSRGLKSLDRLPPLSPAVGRLLSKLVSGNVDFKEISEFVEKDALLCAHVLKLVNSAMFSRGSTIRSIRHAIMLLGIGPLRRATIGFTVSAIFSKVKAAPSWSRRRFNLHSGATALMADTIADLLPVDLKDTAFLGGMMHDLGRVLVAVGLPDEYEKINALAASSGRTLINANGRF